MKKSLNPLNNIYAFMAMLNGAGLAFILAAIFTLDTDIHSAFFKLGIFVLIISAIANRAIKKSKNGGTHNG